MMVREVMAWVIILPCFCHGWIILSSTAYLKMIYSSSSPTHSPHILQVWLQHRAHFPRIGRATVTALPEVMWVNGTWPYLIQCAHPSDGTNVVGDGDQCGSGEVFLADGISLFLTHHVAKAMLEILVRVFKTILRQTPCFHKSTVESCVNNSVRTQMTDSTPWFTSRQDYDMNGWPPFLNRDKIAWLLIGGKVFNASRYLDKNETGETAASFPEPSFKAALF